MTLGYIDARSGYATRHKTLKIGGTDVLTVYADSTTSYSVPIESISLTEEGPGGVSSLSFSIWDPLVEVTLESAANVEFWDWDNTSTIYGRPLFLGFLQAISIRPADGGPGRWLDIDCIGIECLLDWMLVPALTVPAGTRFPAAIQSCVANATGVGWPLRAFSDNPGDEDARNDQAHPVSGYAPGFPSTQYDVVIDGGSLRNAIADCVTACDTWVTGTGAVTSVDFTSGLRVWPTSMGTGTEAGVITTYLADDYTYLRVENVLAPGATHTPASTLKFTIDPSGISRAVYIVGGNAAGSGLVSDGSGIVGPVAFVNDSTILTAAKRNAVAAAYLSQFSQGIRGTFTLENTDTGTGTANVRAGGVARFYADSQTFSADISFTIMSIRKTFYAGSHEDWDIAVGGFVGSAVKQLRRNLRDFRN